MISGDTVSRKVSVSRFGRVTKCDSDCTEVGDIIFIKEGNGFTIDLIGLGFNLT
jgi:hypothetical protein